jgi:hypothetical protein
MLFVELGGPRWLGKDCKDRSMRCSLEGGRTYQQESNVSGKCYQQALRGWCKARVSQVTDFLYCKGFVSQLVPRIRY